MKKYELIKIIGDGTYGIVYEAINRETNQKVAVKKLKDRFSSLEECLNKIEVKVLEKLNHENIVQLKEVIRDKKGEVSYIFEYCDCNLFEFIENHREHKKSIPEAIIREIVFQITKGIKYMHSKGYFHRDLKPENILVILNNYRLNNIIPGEIKIRICDFGTAKEIPIKNIFPMTDYVCTRWYRSPECILRADNYNEKMDVWAIGCVMAELYQLSAIFPGENEFDQLNQILKILGTPTRTKWPWGYLQSELFGIELPVYYKKDFKNILGYINKDGINLLNEIFIFDPVNRPSCSKILNHPYFKVIPKPKINININANIMSNNSNNLKISNRKNNFKNYRTENNYSFSQNKNISKNNRTNNNSVNKYTFIENNGDYEINKKNISKSKNIKINIL